MIKKKIISTLIALILTTLCLCTTGCSSQGKDTVEFFQSLTSCVSTCAKETQYSKDELKEMEAWKKQGEENIRNYIKEKYGTDIHITKIVVAKEDTGPIPDLSRDYIPTVYVNGTINGKECYVVTTNADTSSTEKCYDDYQSQEIVDDLSTYIYKNTSKNDKILYSYLEIYESRNYENGNFSALYHSFYDGDIYKFLQNKNLKGEITIAVVKDTIKEYEDTLSNINEDIRVDIQNYIQKVENFSVDSPYLIEVYCNDEKKYGKVGYQFRDVNYHTHK